MRCASIRVRLAGWYCGVLLAGLALFCGAMWYALQLRLVAGVDRRVAERAAGLRAALEGEADIESEARLRSELDEFAGEMPDGTLVELRAPSGAAIVPEGRQAILGGTGADGANRTVEAGGRSYRAVAVTLALLGAQYRATVAAPLDEVYAVMRTFRNLLLLLAPLVLAVAGVGGYAIGSRALRPVDEITRAAESIGVQDLSERIGVPRTGDELERMAEVWNAMLDRLEASVRRTRQFTADASHELRTPLAVIRTTAELALRRERPPIEYRQALSDIVAQVNRITELTDALLTLARGDAAEAGLRLAAIDVAGLARAVVSECRALAEERGLRLELAAPDAPAMAGADSASIRRLLLILIENAVRHTPRGGTITVSVEAEREGAVVAVADTGEGIAPEALPHVFERFYRADQARTGGSGFGLGLAIAQEIARARGSEIAVESAPGAGARFHLRLKA